MDWTVRPMTMPTVQHHKGFPPCVHLHITFNEHAVLYQTMVEYLESLPDEPDWVSAEERQKALDTNSMWECQWYPVTPVGSCSVAASTFEVLMAYVNETTDRARRFQAGSEGEGDV
jgi:hypothetical protein